MAVASTTTRSVVAPSVVVVVGAGACGAGPAPSCKFTSAVCIRVVKMPDLVLVWPLAEAVIRNGPPVRTLGMSQRPPARVTDVKVVLDDVTTALIDRPTPG